MTEPEEFFLPHFYSEIFRDLGTLYSGIDEGIKSIDLDWLWVPVVHTKLIRRQQWKMVCSDFYRKTNRHQTYRNGLVLLIPVWSRTSGFYPASRDNTQLWKQRCKQSEGWWKQEIREDLWENAVWDWFERLATLNLTGVYFYKHCLACLPLSEI